MLVFFDLETTGLDPDRHQILEVGLIVTDDALEEKATYSKVFHHRAAKDLSIGSPSDDVAIAKAAALYPDIDPYVVKMHCANGLWKESYLSEHKDHAESETEILALLAANMTPGEKPILAGNSVHFDHSFLNGGCANMFGRKRNFPTLNALVHYRHFDCSAINEFAKRFAPKVFENRPRAGTSNGEPAHRALADARESLELARFYRLTLGTVTP